MTLTADYMIKNIFSGMISNHEEENLAFNLNKTEDFFCVNCGEKVVDKFMYNDKVGKLTFLVDSNVCQNCGVLYEICYLYNADYVKIKKYVAKNNLYFFSNSNNGIATIN